ncbi:CDP-diacylglycerol--glycerol-3-phosphate 3-phosphatidyltransferase [Candidatus Williamhamiltonella defendens]|uniref:CDP-diacylglycerol--glycerol-3-phosphate 3-phosphatidyltransferase n=2 Tax=Candidatus Williamhamiltonella defendens TaxID=138072 RepID=A0A2D3TDW3_9ENTR|nr:CDP-diacylglycerol--glycerol-3-phosphate 3-phosphatidyltransferase [Candidatus Hamiltonella defensa]ACQ68152.1 phosphatidylglycerophosphate synthetase [Candidatus Hamiltonella defensa 5AT (Acyrthosiphon pisum)]ASV33269.1 CDP-diacylglycerol--glycerol-3-phosphate 3-phosphatidyltransferase [Candidatus Hamiltonella defensa]ATW22758.1 CDP-diacylglycerol--glycerol-3-phosphate 3-phosphatidyltransferase [Candidatus Hamiltonella defensa]ATW29725.1 CDP-diacylglycerol--glycerol-3-phosphate 3-phosphatid
MQINIPTWLTILRLAFIPFFIVAFYLPFSWAPLTCAMIFVLAAATDWFDGFLASRWKQTTRFGAFLDPVADKIIVAIALILISERYHVWWVTLPAATMISREIIVSALREWMAELGKHNSIVVSKLAKLKTTVQMISLIGLLWSPGYNVEMISMILLYVATVLSFSSMFRYFNAVWKNFLNG